MGYLCCISGRETAMDNLNERIKQAESGDAEAQFDVAWHIVWGDQSEAIEPDWLERAIDYFERAAVQGHGDAMLDLGAMYSTGRGVEQDKGKAFYWFSKAAEILHPKAFRCLGYWLGIPITTGYLDPIIDNADYKSAFNYFLKGAILGEQNSLYELGDLYFSGKYVDVDQTFAFKLYEQSYDIIDYIEDDSYADVCLRLGECYYRGIGTGQDKGAARNYLTEAVNGYELRIERSDPLENVMGGYNRAKFLVGRLDSNKIIEQTVVARKKNDSGHEDFLSSDLLVFPEPAYPIEELERLKLENPVLDAFTGKPLFADELSSAEQGDCAAMYHIAFYCFNRYSKEDNSKLMIDFALYYYHKAIREGYRGAMYNLGSIYYHGDGGVAADKNKAFSLYHYSDATLAQNELGVIFANGEVVPQDYERAFKCFAKGALCQTPLRYAALANLATMYQKGIYVGNDTKFADYLMKLSEKAKREKDQTERDV
ncbi:hypothetical protein FACS1894204_09700 [Synergistales bacterium]|nr:hypothetical protein FACS1894204_09700 [Synergistales bacterium]